MPLSCLYHMVLHPNSQHHQFFVCTSRKILRVEEQTQIQVHTHFPFLKHTWTLNLHTVPRLTFFVHLPT